MSRTRVEQILSEVGVLAFPRVFDTLSAKIAQQAGFPLGFVSGYSVAATAIGEPDLGLLTQTEMIERVYGELRRSGTTLAEQSRLMGFAQFNELIGVEQRYALAEHFGAD
jgi:hypothetical protein